jgi:hypothetical protein
MEARFGPFGDSANLDARWVHGLYRMYHRLENCFGCTLGFGPFGGGVSVVQDRCTVCAKHAIGSGIILDEIDGTPR